MVYFKQKNYKNKEIPFKIGDILEVKVNRLTIKGDGYVREKETSIFIKNVPLGYEGKIKIIKIGPTYVVAEPTEI